MTDEMTLLELLNRDDRFAASNGIQLTQVTETDAEACMTVAENHLNGGGVCQGGALFTLADLAIAAVMNASGQLTFGVENTITFVHSARLGDRLKAIARMTHDHRKLPFCQVEIVNQNQELIATLTALGYRKEHKMPFEKVM